MQHLLITKALLSATSALAFIGVLALTTPNVHADITYETQSNNIISISMSDNINDKIYQVNGKQFHWNDLTEAQQSKVKVIENNIIKLIFAQPVQL